MTTHQRDILVEASIDRLTEIGPSWTEAERDRWLAAFTAIVMSAYPARKRRKPRKAAK